MMGRLGHNAMDSYERELSMAPEGWDIVNCQSTWQIYLSMMSYELYETLLRSQVMGSLGHNAMASLAPRR